MTDSHIHLYRAADRIEAHLLAQELEAEGIRVTLAGGISQLFGEVPMHEARGTELWVAAADLERGSRLLHELFERGKEEGAEPIAAGGASWKCAACGAENEPGFEICWSCCASRGARP